MYTNANNRRSNRLEITMPISIICRDTNNSELCILGQVLNASRNGLKIKLSQFIPRHSIVYVSLPLPFRLRKKDHFKEFYETYAEVIYIKRYDLNDYETGIKLLDNPPADFILFETKKNPLAQFRELLEN